MSYGKAGVGQGLSSGLFEFGRLFAQMAAGRRADERQDLMDQRYTDQVARQDERDQQALELQKISLGTQPGMSLGEAAALPFMSPSGVVQGVRPDTQSFEFGGDTFHFEPGYQDRMARADQMMARDQADQTARRAWNNLPGAAREGRAFDPSMGGVYQQTNASLLANDVMPRLSGPGEWLNAGDRFVQIGTDGNPTGQTISRGEPGGGGGGRSMTDSQGKSIVYHDRGTRAWQEVYDYMNSTDFKAPGMFAEGLSNMGVVGNVLLGMREDGADLQNFNSASDEMMLAILRKDTGAAITDTEMNRYGRIFKPMAGDRPEVVRAKLNRARAALQAIQASGAATTEEAYIVLDNLIADGELDGGGDPFADALRAASGAGQ